VGQRGVDRKSNENQLVTGFIAPSKKSKTTGNHTKAMQKNGANLGEYKRRVLGHAETEANAVMATRDYRAHRGCLAGKFGSVEETRAGSGRVQHDLKTALWQKCQRDVKSQPQDQSDLENALQWRRSNSLDSNRLRW
jgi:hypothetical protein